MGQCCQLTEVETVTDPELPVSQGMRTSDVTTSLVGLVRLGIGKSDVEAIEPFREDRFFTETLRHYKAPGSA